MWDCAGCGENTELEYYMVHDELWEEYGVGNDLLCIGCLEVRLGRTLWSGDFTHFMINCINIGEKSDRLMDRLSQV